MIKSMTNVDDKVPSRNIKHINDKIVGLSDKDKEKFNKKYDECFGNRKFHEANGIDYPPSSCSPFQLRRVIFYELFGQEEKAKNA